MKCVKQEYERLKCLFLNGDESKLELVDGLLKRCAFLVSELYRLEEDIIKNGTIQVSSLGNKRTNPSYKTYLSTLSVYQSIIKTLNSILGSSVDESDDEFTSFMDRINEDE